MQSNQQQHEWVIEPVGRDGKPLPLILGLDLDLVRQLDGADLTDRLAPLPIIEW